MYKVGDKVLVKATVEKVTDDYVRIYAEGYGERSFGLDNAPVEHKTYEQGLADAWEFAKRFAYGDLSSPNKRRDIFGNTGLLACMNPKDGVEEVIFTIEAYEKKKEIKVGDEVKVICGETNGIVTRMDFEGCYVIWADGVCGTYQKSRLEKTGKHIDIESLLKQIGE